MPGPFEITGDLPGATAGPLPETLADVAGALGLWERSRDRERAAMAALAEAVDLARQDGATLAEIAAQIGRTRQYVQKILRRRDRELDELERLHRHDSAQADRDYRRDKAGIGRVNCGSCGAFKSRPSSICKLCGDEPGTHNGDAFEYDEAHYGHRVLR